MNTEYLRLRKKMNEVYEVEPNNLGISFMTKTYRRYNVYFKRMPFLVVIPFSLAAALILYVIFGFILVRAVSLLQYGF